jgi:uncharacterized alkaline shock family protein YloU
VKTGHNDFVRRTTMAEEPRRRRTTSEAVTAGEEISPLADERGATRIADAVVTKVAGIAAHEVPGVYALGGGAARAIGTVTQAVGMSARTARGVSVEVGERQAAVDLTIVVDYGESIPSVAQEVRENVIRRIEGITGLSVTEVNVTVDDLYVPGEEEEAVARVE